MKLKAYQSVTLTTMLALFTTSSLLPIDVAAASTIQSDLMSITTVSNTHTTYSLGPEGLKEAMERMGSSTFIMELYALTILKQGNFNFNGINAVDDFLQTQAMYHQQVARDNASQWLNTIKPQLIATNENIINYNTKFQNFYDTLMVAIDAQETSTLKKGISRLSTSILENKKEVDLLIETLKHFRNKMTGDTQNFKEDANHITSILAGQDAGIPILQNQITTYNTALEKYNAILIGASVATALGPIAIIGGSVVIATGVGTPLGIALIASGTASTASGAPGIALAKKELDQAQAEIHKISGQISQSQLQIVALTNIKNQIEYVTNTIDIAVTALQNISNQWYTMNAKYHSLLQNIDSISPNDLIFIKEDLRTAKDSWKNVEDYAKKLYMEDIKIVDNQERMIKQKIS
ncbi:HBL/NHE enterotoxin family protein [Bacillus thuringiensis]|nr:HBL/NHE enterotoxin family protein [Bacillus thuringiensis]